MMDIVEWLREKAKGFFKPTSTRLKEAADEIERLREALEWYRDAVVIDAKMEGPRYMGCDSSALRRAWEKDRSALQQKETE